MVVDVDDDAALELVDDEEDEVGPASVLGAAAVVGVVAAPAVVAELDPSLLLHAATASAAIMMVAMCLVDFTGLSAIQICARRAGGGLEQCYRTATKSVGIHV
jgi:NO-binding membrane sensor protein with MHYT domain